MEKKKENKDRKIQIRFTDTQLKSIEKKAEADNRTVSDYIRNLTLVDLSK